MQKKSWKTKLAETAQIPKDVSMGLPIIRILGQEEIYIENYRGILEYTATCIRIQTKLGQIYLEGKHLEIAYYTNVEMKIEGNLTQLLFYQGG